MKQRNRNLILIAATAMLAVALPVRWALANTPPANVLTGTVTSVAGSQVVINGTSYSVQLQGPALQQLEQVHAGQQVDVILNGPPGSATSQVVAIHVHNAS